MFIHCVVYERPKRFVDVDFLEVAQVCVQELRRPNVRLGASCEGDHVVHVAPVDARVAELSPHDVSLG